MRNVAHTLFPHPSPPSSPMKHGTSNLYSLLFAFLSFLSFSIVQLCFSLKANSQAMLGDSLTMILDALTYGGNGLAEYAKGKETGRPLRQSKTLLYIECLGPSFSVITLVAVTIYILVEASKTIRGFHDSNDNVSSDDDTNVEIMLLFSSLNLLIDIVNVYNFIKNRNRKREDAESISSSSDVDFGDKESTDNINIDSNNSKSNNSNDDDDDIISNNTSKKSLSVDDNMNMCSAYTHVFADTLRSVAVLVAAMIAEFAGANGEYCDAVAAIVVSAIIGCSACPLIAGLYKLWFRGKDACGEDGDQLGLLSVEEEDKNEVRSF